MIVTPAASVERGANAPRKKSAPNNSFFFAMQMDKFLIRPAGKYHINSTASSQKIEKSGGLTFWSNWKPLSPALSPLVPRGERELDAGGRQSSTRRGLRGFGPLGHEHTCIVSRSLAWLETSRVEAE